MKSGWKDMYFAKEAKAFVEDRAAKARHAGSCKAAHQKANANIGSDAEIAAYLAREPVARRYEYDEPKGEE